MSSLILTWAWQSSSVAAVALVVVAVAGRRRTGFREAILAAAALKFLVPPVVLPLPAIFAAPSFANETVVAAAAIDPGPIDIVTAIYATGAFVVLLMLAASHRRVQRLVFAARFADAAMVERTRTLAARVGIRRPVSVLISEAATAPFAAGVLRPVVVVPASMLVSMTADEIDAVIVHELAHHARGHVVGSWIRGVLCAAWWWNPLAWRLSAALRGAHEDLADDAVLRWSGLDVDRYCDVLVRAARSAAAPSVAPALADRAHPLARRLQRLIDGATAPAPRWQVWALAIVLAALILPSRPPVRTRPPAGANPAAGIVYRDVYAAISEGGAPADVAARIAERASQRVLSRQPIRPAAAAPAIHR